jgi:hypothetical protein
MGRVRGAPAWRPPRADLPSRSMDTIKRLIASAALAGLLATSACTGTVYGEGSYDYYATQPPPAVVVEARGYAPYPDAIWIDGHWGWNQNRYLWHRGYWDHARPGYSYVPHRWYRDRGGWRLSAGYWRRVR